MQASPNSKLFTAIETGDRDLLTEALEQGADVNKWTRAYETPLIMALKTRDCDWLSQELIEHGANFDATDKNDNDAYFWLWFGYGQGNQTEAQIARLRAVNLFMSHGQWRESVTPARVAGPLGRRQTVLSAAAANNFSLGVRFLITQKGMKVDELDTKRRQPIHLTVYNAPEAAGILLAHGASMDARDEKGKSASELVESIHGESAHEWWSRSRKAEMEERLPKAVGKPSDGNVMRL